MSLQQSELGTLRNLKNLLIKVREKLPSIIDKTTSSYNQTSVDNLYKVIIDKKKELNQELLYANSDEFKIDLENTLRDVNEVLLMIEPHVSNELLGVAPLQGDIDVSDADISNVIVEDVVGGRSRRKNSRRKNSRRKKSRRKKSRRKKSRRRNSRRKKLKAQ